MKYLTKEDAVIIAEMVGKDKDRLKALVRLAEECAEAGKEAGDHEKKRQMLFGKIDRFINNAIK